MKANENIDELNTVVLMVMALPLRLCLGAITLVRRWRFYQFAYRSKIQCENCPGTIWLVGMWECGCPARYTYVGHVLRTCPICKTLPPLVRCYNCGVTRELPQL